MVSLRALFSNLMSTLITVEKNCKLTAIQGKRPRPWLSWREFAFDTFIYFRSLTLFRKCMMRENIVQDERWRLWLWTSYAAPVASHVCFFFFCKLMFLLNIMLIYDEPPLAGGTQMQWGDCSIRRKVWLQISSIFFFLLPCHGTF